MTDNSSSLSLSPQRNFQLSVQLMGDRSRSHFGLSLAALGDLNRDGYGDLAVGAPYAGEAARGGVYIFLGGPKGLAKTPSQVGKAIVGLS